MTCVFDRLSSNLVTERSTSLRFQSRLKERLVTPPRSLPLDRVWRRLASQQPRELTLRSSQRVSLSCVCQFMFVFFLIRIKFQLKFLKTILRLVKMCHVMQFYDSFIKFHVFTLRMNFLYKKKCQSKGVNSIMIHVHLSLNIYLFMECDTMSWQTSLVSVC